MTDAQRSSLAQVFTCVNSVYEQCRNLTRDAVRLLRDNEGIFLNQIKAWDWASRPNDHFLEQEFSCIRRCWLNYTVGGGPPQQGALFLFEFFNPHRPVIPSLLFGVGDAGSAEFDSLDRWATVHTILDAERGDPKYTIDQDGPLAMVITCEQKRCPHITLVQVPLESISNQSELERVVVRPMAALLKGDRASAKSLLEHVPVIPWPIRGVDAVAEEEDEDASEHP